MHLFAARQRDDADGKADRCCHICADRCAYALRDFGAGNGRAGRTDRNERIALCNPRQLTLHFSLLKTFFNRLVFSAPA